MSLPRGVRLGIDFGSVRLGLAASDPDGLVATPVATLEPGDRARLVREVCERGAAVVYVGLPRHLSGVEGTAAGSARAYAVSLAGEIEPVEVRMVDERMSTVSATAAMRAAGRAGRRQRSVVDQAAAVVILQGALDAERATGGRAGELVPASPDAETKTEQ